MTEATLTMKTPFRTKLTGAVQNSTVPETADRSDAFARFAEEGADVITFTSSSTVEHFLDLKLPMAEGMKIASIGPITSRTLRERGLKVDIEAKDHSIPGLVDAIVRLSALAVDLKDHVGELDINPLFVFAQGRGVKAADALIRPVTR